MPFNREKNFFSVKIKKNIFVNFMYLFFNSAGSNSSKYSQMTKKLIYVIGVYYGMLCFENEVVTVHLQKHPKEFHNFCILLGVYEFIVHMQSS